MSSTAPNLAQALYDEFELMNNQVYPYTGTPVKTCTFVHIVNNGVTAITITSDTELRFDDGQGYTYPYVFLPRVTSQVLNPSESAQFVFECGSDGVVIPDTALMKLFENNVQITDVSIYRTGIVDGEDAALYYFTYRMTVILAERINAAGIYDYGGEGLGQLVVGFGYIRNALAYGWENILGMKTNPSTSNGPIINTIDEYLDRLTGDFFHDAVHYVYHSVHTMTGTACDSLDSIDLNTTPDAATMMSAELMADIVDYYCNNGLS